MEEITKLSNLFFSETVTDKSMADKSTADDHDDNSTYRVPEYYNYNIMSYYDIEAEMVSHRIKQPSKFDAMKP